MNPGILVISLDFELYWGVRDQRSLASYRENLLGVRAVVPRLLELFSRYGVHATWATVGFLFCETKEELIDAVPEERPRYRDGRLSPYDHIAQIGLDEKRDPFHYAASLIEEVAAVPTQEIGTHTFSHYYCLEPEQDAIAFDADIRAAVEVARRRGITIDSIAFPRNQVNPEYLSICLSHGITAYRGNQRSLMYRTPESGDPPLRRLLRLIDAYVNLSSHHTYSLQSAAVATPLNIPESRFLRPYQERLAPLEPRRLRRILADLEHAAEHGLIYHLWWHPHNFGASLERNFEVLGGVLDRFAALRETHGMQSMAMREVAAQASDV
jgi:peptidoglycan/xylan/chitin deacetylase (PgdA/CDA1 family)